MKIIILFVFSALMLSAHGQDTTYFNEKWVEVNASKDAHYYQLVSYNNVDSNKVKKVNYFISGQIKSELYYSDYKNYELHGKYKQYFENGRVKEDKDYNAGKINGNLLTFWENGNPKRIDLYEEDSLIKGTCFSSDGKEINYFDYIINAQFPGGTSTLNRFLGKETLYPENSMMNEIQGRVQLKFVVNKDGSISNVEIIDSVNAELDAEAIRVVKKMPNWEPGLRDGEPVRTFYKLPFSFRLQ